MKVPFLPPLLVLIATGCTLLDPHRAVDRREAPQYLARAEADLVAGESARALRTLLRLRNTEQLDPDLRARADRELQRAFEALLARHAQDEEVLLELMDLPLPARLRAIAGVTAAGRMLEQGRHLEAYRAILQLDAAVPMHPSRTRAGEIVARAGLEMIRTGGTYRLFLSYRTQGMAALEYLVLNYPGDPRCPEAYYELAQHYERRRDLDEAIARCEDLLVYHPGSPYAVGSEARLPYLRMLRLEHDSYDRRELMEARREIERWLTLHTGHELEPWMRELRVECYARLARNDLIVARHYRRVRSDFGARIHAERALTEAQLAGDEALVQRARRLLEATAAAGETRPPAEPPETTEIPASGAPAGS